MERYLSFMYNGGIFCLHISNERYKLQLSINTTAG